MENESETTVESLKKAKDNYPHLIPLLELEERIWALQDGAKEKMPPQKAVGLSGLALKEKLSKGEPLVDIHAMEIDWEAFSSLLQEIGQILAAPSAEVAKLVGDFNSRFFSKEKWLDLAASEPGEKNVEDRFAQALVISALKPFLQREREALLPLVDQDLWIRRYCPICGSRPDFSLLEEDVGVRHLVCSRCDAKWRYKRLECPFCGTEDASRLAYYPSEDEAYRLYICENCKHFLKALDLRIKPGDPDVRVERVITVAMNLAAEGAGYI